MNIDNYALKNVLEGIRLELLYRNRIELAKELYSLGEIKKDEYIEILKRFADKGVE